MIVDIHDHYRAKVDPPASNMLKMVTTTGYLFSDHIFSSRNLKQKFTEFRIFCKVSKKDDKVDLNELSTKYTKIYLNSNIFLKKF